MAKSTMYPKDVVAAFVVRENERRDREAALLREIFGSAPKKAAKEGKGRKRTTKERALQVLQNLVETMLFASMATEEGQIQPAGVVFAEGREHFTGDMAPWETLFLTQPRPFGVHEVTKLAATCDFPRSLLAVMLEKHELRIVGIVTPDVRAPRASDYLVRVIAPQPGTVVVFRGRSEVVRYVRGRIVPVPADFLDQRQHQMTSIGEAVFKAQWPLGLEKSDIEHYVFEELLRVVARMRQIGRGGLLAVLGPKEKAASLLQPLHKLDTPIEYGTAIRMHLQATVNSWEMGKSGSGHLERGPSQESLARLREQLVRLTAVDGAVVLSHSLQVLGFGVKLHSPATKKPPSVHAVNQDGTLGGEWALQSRGSRHKAAATFAKNHPEGLAFIVSQDGDAAVFQSRGKHVAHWPLGMPLRELP